MKSLESEQQPSRVEEAKSVIMSASQRIEAEFVRSKNTWLECFGSSIFALETYLDSDKVEAEVGVERYKEIMKRLEELKTRHYELKQQYPDKDDVPSDNIKEELFRMLNVLE